MSHVIFRGANLRRHEVDFGEDPISVSMHASDEVIEIFIEADGEDRPEERRRFALVICHGISSVRPSPISPARKACRRPDQREGRRADAMAGFTFAIAVRKTVAEAGNSSP